MTTLSIAPAAAPSRSSFKTTWVATALLPLPVLMAVNPAYNAEISCLYLGLASTWLAIHIIASGGLPQSRGELGMKLTRLYAALCANLAVFLILGLAPGVESKFPFPLMAVLSVLPAMGLIPALMLRIPQTLAVIVLAAIIELSGKLAGCVLARFVYGPNFQIEGRIAGDWGTARLMITTFWIISSSVSVIGLAAAFLSLPPATRDRRPQAASSGAPGPSI